jgi:hypothetical protein
MKSRVIVLITLFIAWGLNIFLFVNTDGNPRLLLPATGGYYPWAIQSGEPSYNPALEFVWNMGELAVFVALGTVAFIKRSTILAIICSLLWLGSLATGIYRFAVSMQGIH